MDKPGTYELELKVSDDLSEVSDKLQVSNGTPVLNRVDANYRQLTNVVQPKQRLRIHGDFFSPSVSDNAIFIGDIEYEITDLQVNSDGGDEDIMLLKVPDNAITGELKLMIGEGHVSWEEPIRIVSFPVSDFVSTSEHLEEQFRSEGNVPDTYFEIGTRFMPKVDGQVLGFRLRASISGNYEVNLWNVETKLRMGTSSIDISSTGGSTHEIILTQGIALKADKEYIVSYNSNDWYLHIDEEDAQANQFPKTTYSIEVLGTAFLEGQGAIFPDEGYPVNYIVKGADVIFAADLQ